jgi:hypothetical protein
MAPPPQSQKPGEGTRLYSPSDHEGRGFDGQEDNFKKTAGQCQDSFSVAAE